MSLHSASKRVGLYHPYPHSMGGSQRILLELATFLPSHGYDPIVICPEEGRLTEVARSHNLEVLVCDPGSVWHVYGQSANAFGILFWLPRVGHLLRYWARLCTLLRKREICLLHCNDYRGVIMAAPAARLAGIPVIWHMHGFVPSLWLNALTASMVDYIVPVSNGMLAYWKMPQWFLRNYRVIYNGIYVGDGDIASQTASFRKWGQGPSVVSVGVLHPRKGYDVLLRAFAKVVEVIPQARCRIIGGRWGDGRYERYLHTLSQRLGISEAIEFAGQRSDVMAILSESDLVVIPSRIEAFGMVALEAMLAGKPVVASRTGGLQDIVVHGETGLLVEPENPDELAVAMIELLRNKKLAERMGEAGRKRVIQLFTAERMAASFAELYNEMIEGQKREKVTELA
jgi:glycosyltransferase involved in cell wall biosynthesis